ncbi:MAG: hypothetical protein ACO2ZM_07130 [Francisellaceae bacterium]
MTVKKQSLSFKALATTSLLFLAGCAHVPDHVPMDKTFITQDRDTPVEIAAGKIPKAESTTNGIQGLLDYAIISAMMSSLSDALENYKASDFYTITNDANTLLTKYHIKHAVLDKRLNIDTYPKFDGDIEKNKRYYSPVDYRRLKSEFGTNKLLVFNISQLGTTRKYYAFMPLEAPRTIAALDGQLINLDSNEIIWRDSANITLKIEGEWDNPPDFPELKRSLSEAIDLGKSKILANLKAELNSTR